MSYLTLPEGPPDFGAAVVSLWFRVQQDTIERVAQEVENFAEETRPRMLGIMPLLVFGQMFEGYQVETESKGTRTYTETIKSFTNGAEFTVGTVVHSGSIGPLLKVGKSYDEDPSYVGINCYFDRDTGETIASLRIRFQTRQSGSGSWVNGTKDIHSSDYSSYAVADSTAPTAEAYDTNLQTCVVRPDAGVPLVQTSTNVDQSQIFTDQRGPDSIEVGPAFADSSSDFMKIEPDTWHHLLLSFDLMQHTIGEGTTAFEAYTCSPTPVRTVEERKQITDPCQVYIALDDVNRSGKALDDPRYTNPNPGRLVAGLGDNGVAPFYAIWATFVTSGGNSANEWVTTGTRRVVDNPMAGMPTYNFNPAALPTGGYALGLPGVPQVEHAIRHVEMAEFQLFTDVTLDTGIEGNRRAFIDAEGNPVDPTGTDTEPAPAVKLLGKKPDILLHGSGDWQIGDNTGNDDTGAAVGDFTPVAKIEPYLPDPALGV